ncbi:MAG TPA: hypothetical protein VK436_13155 [Methanocella sp.]|nr:hypothetical protein [Methanocella sp.]
MPELRAINPVKTALDRTIKLLFKPFDVWLWVKLVIITLFSGGSQALNPLDYTQNNSSSEPLTGDSINHFVSYLMSSPILIALTIGIIILITLVILLLLYLKGVFSFVLLNAITSGNVQIMKPFSDNMRRGFKVFLFNVLITIVSLAVTVLLGGAILLSVLWIINSAKTSGVIWTFAAIWIAVGIIMLGIALLLPLLLIIGLANGFFYDFALPLMLFKNMGLKESIDHVFKLVKMEPVEFIVYVILRWVLEAASGILMLFIIIFIMAIFIVAAAAVAVMAIAAASVSIWLIIPFVPVILIGFILLIVTLALVSLPVNIYLRYYSLDFLRSFDAGYVQYTGRFAPSEDRTVA